MLEVLTAPPHFITADAHAQLTSSTPSSFTDIPPILHFQDDVEIIMLPTDKEWAPWGGVGKVTGTLWITEDLVSFQPTNQELKGFNLDFQSLTLHALTPAGGEFGSHLYCQIDESAEEEEGHGQAMEGVVENGHGEENGDGEEEDEDEEEGQGGDFSPMRELRIFVQDSKCEPLWTLGGS
ncbi:chloride channel, nucleotide-sensitive, 1A, partial [Tremellales sp. Uapishka_1]